MTLIGKVAAVAVAIVAIVVVESLFDLLQNNAIIIYNMTMEENNEEIGGNCTDKTVPADIACKPRYYANTRTIPLHVLSKMFMQSLF